VPINPNPPPGYCPCGEPLHYHSPEVREAVDYMVEKFGPTVIVQVGERRWRVNKHYIALHGLKGADLPTLGFPEIRAEET
jgi:hypothetical protein